MEGRWADLWAAERRAATATVALGVVLFAFNAFVISTALPRAVAEFGGARWLAWAFSLYIICSIVSGSSSALVIHRFGARRVFLGGGVVFLAGTLLAAGAPSMPWLFGGRVLQGAAAGLIESGCYVLIPQLFPQRLLSRVFGLEALAWAVAALAAPVLAGVLTEVLGWRAALLSALPMALIFLALVPRVVPAGRAQGEAPRLPLGLLAGLAAGMGLVVAADQDMGAGLRLAALLAGLATIVAVVRRDRRRLLPEGAFSLGGVVGLGLWVMALLPLSETMQAVFLVYGLQNLWGWSPSHAGLAVTVLALSWSVMQTWSASWRVNRARQIVVGAGLMVAGQGMLALAFWWGSAPALFLAQVLVGAALGLSWGALAEVVMRAAGAEDRDRASGILPVVFSAGFGIGAALYGLYANGLGFAGAKGAALEGVYLALIALAGVMAALALAAALRMAVLDRKGAVG